MIHQSQSTQPNSQSLLISGLFPSGESFSDVVDADSSYEAMIRVISQARYSDAGGDLEVIQVADARTGAQCGFHAIRPPSPLSSGQAFHGHLATCSTAIRPGSRSAATQGGHC